VLVGLLTAVGLLGASGALGLAQFLTVYAGLSLFTVAWVLAVVASVDRELHGRGPGLVRIGLAIALTGMVLFGLAKQFAVYGLLAAAAAVVTSPTATRQLAHFRRSIDRAPAEPPVRRDITGRDLIDQEMVDREFDGIVAHLGELDDHFPES
jgi:hypothetical protein